MKSSIALLFALIIGLFHVTPSLAAEPINTLDKASLVSKFKPSGIAIRGYDTVAYFTEDKPVKGSNKFTSDWNGATWRFASQANLDLFESDPEKYAPQYGGYCAYGVAQGYLVKIDPDQWSIIDGKLYLNYNGKFQRKWEKDIAGYIQTADNRFETLLNEN